MKKIAKRPPTFPLIKYSKQLKTMKPKMKIRRKTSTPLTNRTFPNSSHSKLGISSDASAHPKSMKSFPYLTNSKESTTIIQMSSRLSE